MVVNFTFLPLLFLNFYLFIYLLAAWVNEMFGMVYACLYVTVYP